MANKSAKTVSADDFVEILNLYARYNFTSDAGDAAGYADCFVEDGILETRPLDYRVAGRANLVIHKQRDAAGRGGRYRRHWNTNISVEIADDGSVIGRCYFIGYNGEPGQLPQLGDCGVYEDRLSKVGGRWRFVQRVLTMDATTWTKK